MTRAAPSTDDGCAGVDRLTRRVARGHFHGRSPDLIPVPRRPHYIGTAQMPPHSGPWDYLVDVPLLLYGPGHIAASGRVDGEADLADVAPTIARMIGFGPLGADGRVLERALVGSARPPRLVVTVVWDGGGWNVLRRHPRAWPFLRQLLGRGTSFVDATVGSSPSVTPPIHTTIGTGDYPSRHGVVDLKIRVSPGEFVDPFKGGRADKMNTPSLADVYDPSTDNQAVVGMLGSRNWHLGMIGRGAGRDGADKDLVALIQHAGEIDGNRDLYRVPDIGEPELLQAMLDELDARDGERDQRWRTEPLALQEAHLTPAMVRYEGAMLRRLITRFGFGADRTPDLLYVNVKTADVAGHRWGIGSRQVRDAIAAKDRALKRLVRLLDERVGERRWALVLTADHGQMPYPSETGAWPIAGRELGDDLNRAFAGQGERVVERVGTAGIHIDERVARAGGADLDEMADWLGRYAIRDNLKAGQAIPAEFDDRRRERLFDVVMVAKRASARVCGWGHGVRFTESAAEAGIDLEVNRSWGALWADHDRDSDPDLLVNRHFHDPVLYTNDAGKLAPASPRGELNQDGFDRHNCAWGEANGDGRPDLYCTQGAQRGTGVGPNQLLVQGANGRLHDVARRLGVDDPRGRGRSANWLDIDADGDLDLFVGNQRRPGYGNTFFENTGAGFRRLDAGVDADIATVSSSWADIDNDRDPDLLLIGRDRAPTLFLNDNGRFSARPLDDLGDHGWLSGAWGDLDDDGWIDLALVRHGELVVARNERGRLRVHQRERLRQGRMALWVDLDNDSRLDLFVVQGAWGKGDVEGAPDRADVVFVQRGGRLRRLEVPGTYRREGNGDAAAAADFDRDGDVDLFVTHGYKRSLGEFSLLRNDSRAGRSTALRLDGGDANPFAFGARVRMRAGARRIWRHVSDAVVFHGQSEPGYVHVGLGRSRTASAKVLWPDGSADCVELRAGATRRVRKGRAPCPS